MLIGTDEGRKTNTLEELDYLVWDWAVDKGIPSQSTPVNQLTKTMEEVAEAIREVVAYQDKFDKFMESGQEESSEELHNLRRGIRSEFGDILVTWIIAAGMLNLSMEECLQEAYDKIKVRTGRMINGVWVKDAP